MAVGVEEELQEEPWQRFQITEVLFCSFSHGVDLWEVPCVCVCVCV